MTHTILRTAVVLAMAIGLAVSGVSVVGAQSDGPTTIDSCTTITEPGVYELTDNLTDQTANTTIFEIDGTEVTACVVVQSDDVVLEGNGNAIDGTSDDGVVTDLNETNVSLANETNVSLANQTTDGTLENVTDAAESNETDPFAGEAIDVGVAVLPPSDSEDDLRNVTVRNVETSEWFAGMYVENVTESTVQNVASTDNVEIGLELSSVTFSTVSDVSATDNGGIGYIVYGSDDNELTALEAEDNGFVGFVVGESDRNRVTDVRAVNQSIAGLAFFNSSYNVVTGVEVRETGGEFAFGPTGGLVFDSSSNNGVTDVTASDNRNWTYYATNGSADNTVLNLTDDGRTVSFIATDVAVRFDDDATEGSPLVVLDTTENASILVDARWTPTTLDDSPVGEAGNETTETATTG